MALEDRSDLGGWAGKVTQGRAEAERQVGSDCPSPSENGNGRDNASGGSRRR